MKAVILYDSKTQGGSTEVLIDSIGQHLAESGLYVEKAKCIATADYSFVKEFDIVILGAPVYYFVVSPQLLGAFLQGNLKKNLKKKKVALFLTCGTAESMASLFYLPQLKIHLLTNRILVEKIFNPVELSDANAIESFVDDLLEQYERSAVSRKRTVIWSDEAQDLLEAVPGFLQEKFRSMAEEYAMKNGYKEISVEMLETARDKMEKKSKLLPNRFY
jgi:multimeric flavodoxin WrbA